MRRWVNFGGPPSRTSRKDPITRWRNPMHLYFVGLDVHKQVIAYCVKTAGGDMVMEGRIPATRTALDQWVVTLPGPWHGGLEATLFSHWIFRHLRPTRRAWRWDIRRA